MGIRLKDLSKLGYRDNVARSLVVDIVSKHCKYITKELIDKVRQLTEQDKEKEKAAKEADNNKLVFFQCLLYGY